MRRRIMLFIIALGLLVVISATSTYAWFAAIKRTGKIVFIAGEVNYGLFDASVAFISTDVIVPGQELVDQTMTITNYSIVESELRLKIQAIITNPDLSQTVYDITDAVDGYAIGVIGPASDTARYYWEYQEDYWYLYLLDEEDLPFTAVPRLEDEDDTPLSFEILQSLIIDGEKSGSALANDDVMIKFLFQAKQAEEVTWDDLGEADFVIE